MHNVFVFFLFFLNRISPVVCPTGRDIESTCVFKL
jgi:hypothetical protein